MAKLTNAQLNALVAKLESEIQALRALVTNTESIKVVAYHEDQGYGVVTIKEALGNPLVSIVDNIDGLDIVYKPIAQPKLPGGNPNVVRVEDSKVLTTMRWLMKYVGFQSTATDQFLTEFEVYTNKEKNWLAVYPKKGLQESGKFVKELNQARYARQVQGNYWKNYGMWVNIPVKK